MAKILYNFFEGDDKSDIDSLIINLSSRILTINEQSLLRNGLKFCPPPQQLDNIHEKIDRNAFCKKERLIEYFHETTQEEESIVKPKSQFEPLAVRSALLDNCIALIKSLPQLTGKHSQKHSITMDERRALSNLSQASDIVIKEANKGSAVMIMGADYYKEKIDLILNNVGACEKIPLCNDRTVMRKIGKLAEKYKNFLTEKEDKYITNFETKKEFVLRIP